MSTLICDELEIYTQIINVYAEPRDKMSVSIYQKIVGLMRMWKKAEDLGDHTAETKQIMINCLILCIAIIRNGDNKSAIKTDYDKRYIRSVLSKVL